MSESMFDLIIMESIKCIIAAWVGYMLWRLVKVLEKIEDKQK